MKKLAIIYGSSTGNTEAVALRIADKVGKDRTAVINVKDLTPAKLAEYKNLVLGISTWGIGEIQGDWKKFLGELDKYDLKDKTIALFGLGDAESYPDSFVDGMGTVYEALKDKGCLLVGQVNTEDYNFDRSTAVYDGKFVGLPLDEDNENELTEPRIDKWIDYIIDKFQ